MFCLLCFGSLPTTPVDRAVSTSVPSSVGPEPNGLAIDVPPERTDAGTRIANGIHRLRSAVDRVAVG
jgi:hypothetical protein